MGDNTVEATHHYAGVLLVTESGKLIAQQRDDKPGIDNPGRVATFGGAVDPGEDFRHAAWREIVEEETNLNLNEEDFEHFLEDRAWRPLTAEWAERHFFIVTIPDSALETLEIYEGKGWVALTDSTDERIVDSWRPVFDQFFNR